MTGKKDKILRAMRDARDAMDAAEDRPAVFRREEIVREEITSWQIFMMEARAVRQAIDEWRQLDTDTCAPLDGDSENE